SFGVLPAEIATSLVMVLNELLLNAAEHAFPTEAGADDRAQSTPEVVVTAHRHRRQLHVSVADNGRGLPPDFDAERGGRLGLQIVQALATGELRGTIELRNRPEGGTEALLTVPLDRR